MDLNHFDKMPTVKAVMTPFPWTIQIDDSLTHARQVMDEQQIRHLPVTQDGELVAIVTDRDIGLATGLSDRSESLRVADACTRDIYVVSPESRLDELLLEMAERRLGSALVVRRGKLVGIVTAIDACRGFGQVLRSSFGGDADDAA